MRSTAQSMAATSRFPSRSGHISCEEYGWVLRAKRHRSFVSDQRKRAGSSTLIVWLRENAVIGAAGTSTGNLPARKPVDNPSGSINSNYVCRG